MGELTVTVNIADRPYRLTIDTVEEENVRKAVRMLNDKINDYSKAYAFKDKQDLLAMVAVQYATGVVDYEMKETVEKKKNIERLVDIDHLLTETLSKD